MRNGVSAVWAANDPAQLYVRCTYHEFWYGPFADESAVVGALRKLDAADPMWDYDGFCIHYGVVKMTDAVYDPVYVTDQVRARISAQRRN